VWHAYSSFEASKKFGQSIFKSFKKNEQKDMKKIKNICIVGGGSAGYMLASYMSAQAPVIKITMIVPEKEPTVGVGEATLLDFKPFMDACGLYNEKEWMYATDATYKCGINHTGWRKDGQDVWHSFGQFKESVVERVGTEGIVTQNKFEQFKWAKKPYKFFVEEILPHYNIVIDELRISPNKGYHLDSQKWANYLKNNLITKYNVTFINKKIIKVNGTDKCTGIVYDDGTADSYDFYIDCTGFAAIFKDIGNLEFQDLSDYILSNSACATHISYKDIDKEQFAYTRPDATDDGWCWTIPIKTRIGSGWVYNDEFLDEEGAEVAMKNYWGEDRIIDGKFTHLHWKTGYNKNMWRDNVISIGLSNGFIEPLESTGISFFLNASASFVDRIKKGFILPDDITMFNSQMGLKYQEAGDFVLAHYNPDSVFRNTPFWNKVKKGKSTSSLEKRHSNYLEYGARNELLSLNDNFANHSWATVFEGFYKDGYFNG